MRNIVPRDRYASTVSQCTSGWATTPQSKVLQPKWFYLGFAWQNRDTVNTTGAQKINFRCWQLRLRKPVQKGSAEELCQKYQHFSVSQKGALAKKQMKMQTLPLLVRNIGTSTAKLALVLEIIYRYKNSFSQHGKNKAKWDTRTNSFHSIQSMEKIYEQWINCCWACFYWAHRQLRTLGSSLAKVSCTTFEAHLQNRVPPLGTEPSITL
jgi:hypothetical protein